MITSESVIQVMDLNRGEVYTDTVKTIFGKLMTHSTKPDVNVIELNDTIMPKLKIVDMFGWSEIIKFMRVGIDATSSILPHRFIIETKYGKILECMDGTKIPVYNSGAIKRGFHGETKYQYNIKSPATVESGDIIRVSHCKNEDDYDINFDEVVSIKHCLDYPISTYYIIQTKSKFMSCNDVYLYNGADNDCKCTNQSNCSGCSGDNNI